MNETTQIVVPKRGIERAWDVPAPWQKIVAQPHALEPLSVCEQALPGGALREVFAFPTDGELEVGWVMCANGAFEVVVDCMRLGPYKPGPRICSNIDPAALRWGDYPIAMKIGRVTAERPIQMKFRSFGLPKEQPFLNLWFYGRRVR